jgi:hypothetical protein
MSARITEPGNANTRAESRGADACPNRIDNTDNLVTRHDWQPGIGQITVDDMQISATYGAGLDPHADIAGARYRIRSTLGYKRRPDRV